MMPVKEVDIRNHKVKCDFGLQDYYRYYRQCGGVANYKVFAKCIREFNSKIMDYLLHNEYTYKLPAKMGAVTIKKVRLYIKFNDKSGKIRTNYPIDWPATNDLWERFPEKRKLQYIYRENKHSNKYKYEFYYQRTKANYVNKTIYMLRFNRQLKRRFAKYIFSQGEIERGMQYEVCF